MCEHDVSLFKKNMEAQLTVHKVTSKQTTGLLDVLWTDGTKDMFGHIAQPYIWRTPNMSTQRLHTNCEAQWWRGDDLDSFLHPKEINLSVCKLAYDTPEWERLRLLVKCLLKVILQSF